MLLPLLISLAFLITISFIARKHTFGTYATETDFYHFYAPDAERIAAGEFPENPFQGPGYPAVLAFLSNLTGGDLFIAGKWLSIIGASLVGLLAFLLFNRLFGYWAGIGAQVILFVSYEFPKFAMNATTDIFFLLLCLAALVIFTTDRLPTLHRTALTGAITSLAYLTRYNGLFLLLVILFGILLLNLFEKSIQERVKLSAIFVVIFLVIASPWFYANYKHRGSPLYNANYLNIATEFYPELVDDNVFQEGTRKLDEMFHSFGDVLRYNPQRILKHYPENLYESLRRSITGNLVSSWVGWFAVLGLIVALIERRSKLLLLVFTSGVLYLLLLALTHWEGRYYFYILALYAGFAAYAPIGLLNLARARGLVQSPAFVILPITLIFVMAFTSFKLAEQETSKFIASHPTEVIRACDYFKQENIRGALVLARKPHLAYICGQRWVFFPQVKSLYELKSWLEKNPVDYVTISTIEIARRRELAPLKDSKNAPTWLEPVWTNNQPTFILYRPRLGGANE